MNDNLDEEQLTLMHPEATNIKPQHSSDKKSYLRYKQGRVLPQRQYKDLGQHMTPLSIAGQMAEIVTIPVLQWKVIDPACGDGNLLIAAIDKMMSVGVCDILDRFVGIDIDCLMVDTAKRRIAMHLGVEPADVPIYNEDFFHLFHEDLFQRYDFCINDFNVVISNPPYGQLREYVFFERCVQQFMPGTELVFLLPLAFIDRVSGVDAVPLKGRPLGVTTGHVIVHHMARKPFSQRLVKEHQTNSSAFEVLSGVKLYELGGGTPPQTEDIVRTKPYSSDYPRDGWLPCLRTGDIHPYIYKANRLFVSYGKHLAHPKELERFQGPRIFLRRVPIWETRQLGAVFLEETALCAGDVLVIRHKYDDSELLKGLCVFLNSESASQFVLSRRPSVHYRDSYPKFSAKDINALFENCLPCEDTLHKMALNYVQIT